MLCPPPHPRWQGRKASENPTGIETIQFNVCPTNTRWCRKASENPTGIETSILRQLWQRQVQSRKASENPTGIETSMHVQWDVPCRMVARHQKTQQGLKPPTKKLLEGPIEVSQGIRKPNRDWNLYPYPVDMLLLACRKASENPTGIETSKWWFYKAGYEESQGIRKPNRDWNNKKMSEEIQYIDESQCIRKPNRDWNFLPMHHF